MAFVDDFLASKKKETGGFRIGSSSQNDLAMSIINKSFPQATPQPSQAELIFGKPISRTTESPEELRRELEQDVIDLAQPAYRNKWGIQVIPEKEQIAPQAKSNVLAALGLSGLTGGKITLGSAKTIVGAAEEVAKQIIPEKGYTKDELLQEYSQSKLFKVEAAKSSDSLNVFLTGSRSKKSKDILESSYNSLSKEDKNIIVNNVLKKKFKEQESFRERMEELQRTNEEEVRNIMLQALDEGKSTKEARELARAKVKDQIFTQSIGKNLNTVMIGLLQGFTIDTAGQAAKLVTGKSLEELTGVDLPVAPAALKYTGFTEDQYRDFNNIMGQVNSGVGLASQLAGGFVTYGGIAKQVGKIIKTMPIVGVYAEAHPVISSYAIQNFGEEMVEMGVRQATGQEYTFNDFLLGISMGFGFETLGRGLKVAGSLKQGEGVKGAWEAFKDNPLEQTAKVERAIRVAEKKKGKLLTLIEVQREIMPIKIDDKYNFADLYTQSRLIYKTEALALKETSRIRTQSPYGKRTSGDLSTQRARPNTLVMGAKPLALGLRPATVAAPKKALPTTTIETPSSGDFNKYKELAPGIEFKNLDDMKLVRSKATNEVLAVRNHVGDEVVLKAPSVRPPKPEVLKTAGDFKKEVVKAESEIKAAYKKAEGADRALGEVFAELDIAEAGKRIFVDGEVTGIESTFPKWVPENLRSKKLFEKVMGSLEIDNLKYPTGNRPKQRQLYDLILDRVDKVLGISTKPQRQSISNLYETKGKGVIERQPSKEVAKKPEFTGEKEVVTTRPAGVPAAGEKGVSKIARSINTKAVEKGLGEAFKDEAGFTKIKIKEQARLAKDLMENDFEFARNIIKGVEPIPQGLNPMALIKTMEDYALNTRDGVLAQELINSPLITETSTAAQTLRLAAERDPDSATAKMLEIRKAREKTAEKKRLGKSEKEVKASMKGSMEAKIAKKKPTKKSWERLLDEITC